MAINSSNILIDCLLFYQDNLTCICANYVMIAPPNQTFHRPLALPRPTTRTVPQETDLFFLFLFLGQSAQIHGP